MSILINNPLLPLFTKENPYEELLNYFLQEVILDTNLQLNAIQKEILNVLLAGNSERLIYPRKSGTSTAIELFLLFNLITGKYPKVALISPNRDYINSLSSKVIENISKNSTSVTYNNNTVDMVSLNKISIVKDEYDLIIFDNISNCDITSYESVSYGISIYTSEIKYDAKLKTIINGLKTIKYSLSEITDLQDEINNVDIMINNIETKIIKTSK